MDSMADGVGLPDWGIGKQLVISCHLEYQTLKKRGRNVVVGVSLPRLTSGLLGLVVEPWTAVGEVRDSVASQQYFFAIAWRLINSICQRP